MNAPTDGLELLREYQTTGSEAAFAALVRRYLDLVYSVALRRSGGDVTLASEVAQTVFIDLARRSQNPRGHESKAVFATTSLGGWLYRHTSYVSATAIRSESRRRQREETAMQLLNQTDSIDWTRVAPLLDDALAELSDADRDALVLRFFEKETFARIGSRLGASEDAARMRVERALNRLREQLTRRDITSTTAALASALSAFGIIPAPAGLLSSVTAVAFSQSPVALPIAGNSSSWLMIRPKLAFGILGGTLLAVGVVHQRGTVERLNQENAALRQQQSALATPDSTDLDDVRQGQIQELMQLREEVARLSRELSAAEAKLATAAAKEATNALPIQVSFTGQVLELPNSSFKTLGLFVGPNEFFLMESAEAQFLLQRLKQVAEAKPLGNLDLTVENGQQGGAIFDTRGQEEGSRALLESFRDTGTNSVPSDRDSVYVGLFPKASRTSRKVELEFNMRDGNGRWTKTPGADPAADVPDASWWGITRVLKVSDGQFVVFRRPAKPALGLATPPDRSLLVLVRLTVVDSMERRIFPEEAEATARVEEAAAP